MTPLQPSRARGRGRTEETQTRPATGRAAVGSSFPGIPKFPKSYPIPRPRLDTCAVVLPVRPRELQTPRCPGCIGATVVAAPGLVERATPALISESIWEPGALARRGNQTLLL